MAGSKKSGSKKSHSKKADAKKSAKTASRHSSPAVAALPDDVLDSLRWEVGSQLSDDTASGKPGFKGKKAEGAKALAQWAPQLADQQERLYANATASGTRSVLLVLQGMDTSGKGGIIDHVLGEVNPQGLRITAFKAPTPEEKSHAFLWRIRRALPAAGKIGVFDRSHYEDVLVHRVRKLSTLAEVDKRYPQIERFEDKLVADGTAVIKVMLHLSRKEQGLRLAARLDDPDKYWKFNPGDLDDRALWDQYQDAYRIAMDRTSTDTAPWYVVPADHKWYARLAVQSLLLRQLRSMDLQWPAADFDVEVQKRRLAELG